MFKTHILKNSFGAYGPNRGHLSLTRPNSVAGLCCPVRGTGMLRSAAHRPHGHASQTMALRLCFKWLVTSLSLCLIVRSIVLCC